jgi:hypothetical protein
MNVVYDCWMVVTGDLRQRHNDAGSEHPEEKEIDGRRMKLFCI